LERPSRAIRILDQLMRHATVVITDGQSYRMKDAQNRSENAQPRIPRWVGTFSKPPADTSTWPLTAWMTNDGSITPENETKRMH
jgi:hypothetical protein